MPGFLAFTTMGRHGVLAPQDSDSDPCNDSQSFAGQQQQQQEQEQQQHPLQQEQQQQEQEQEEQQHQEHQEQYQQEHQEQEQEHQEQQEQQEQQQQEQQRQVQLQEQQGRVQLQEPQGQQQQEQQEQQVQQEQHGRVQQQEQSGQVHQRERQEQQGLIHQQDQQEQQGRVQQQERQEQQGRVQQQERQEQPGQVHLHEQQEQQGRVQQHERNGQQGRVQQQERQEQRRQVQQPQQQQQGLPQKSTSSRMQPSENGHSQKDRKGSIKACCTKARDHSDDIEVTNDGQTESSPSSEKKVTFAAAALLVNKFDVPPELLALRRKAQTEENRKANNTLCIFYWMLVVLILMLISFTIWLSVRLTHKHYETVRRRQNERRKAFGFDDLFNSSFQPREYTSWWAKGRDILLYRLPDGPLLAHDAWRNTTTVLVDVSIFDELNTDLFFVSPDMKFILLPYDVKPHWRHSYKARYKIYDRTPGQEQLVDFPNDDVLGGSVLQYAGWAQTGHVLSFVLNNDLYMQASPHSAPRQLTVSGQSGTVFNGVPDWLYEGEILHSNVAHWWSPDNKYLCYAMLNCSLIPVDSYPVYDTGGGLYASTVNIRIPKAGEPSGATTLSELFVINTHEADVHTKRIAPPSAFEQTDHYISHIKWKDTTHVAVVWTSRAQNESLTYICETTESGHVCSKNFHQSVENGWIEQSELHFYRKDNSYLTLLPKEEGGSGNWQHVALVSGAHGSRASAVFLTEGMQEIEQIVGYDPEKHIVYYISTNGDARHRHLLRIGLPTAELQYREASCLTCDDPTCTYVTASFSDSGHYCVLSCLGPDLPNITLRDVSAGNKLIATLVDNTELREGLEDKLMPLTRFVNVPLGNGYDAWVKVVIPHDTEEDSSVQQLPLVIQLYSAPGEQTANDRYLNNWGTYIASSPRFVYATVNIRGSSGSGDRVKHAIYRHIEDVSDIVTVLKFLQENLIYTNKYKVAVYGWGFGGFLTAHLLVNETKLCACGLMLGTFYDVQHQATAFSERYMGFDSPADNKSGYQKTVVMNKIDNLRKKDFLIAHGLADDVVPFSNAMPVVKMLIDADMQFSFQAYPDITHSKLQKTAHLYKAMEQLLWQCWKRDDDKSFVKLDVSSIPPKMIDNYNKYDIQ